MMKAKLSQSPPSLVVVLVILHYFDQGNSFFYCKMKVIQGLNFGMVCALFKIELKSMKMMFF